MSRCANTIAALARLHLDATWGAAGLDAIPTSLVPSNAAAAALQSGAGGRVDGFKSFFSKLVGAAPAALAGATSGTSLRARISRGGAPVSAVVRRRLIVRAMGMAPFRTLQADVGRALFRPVVVKALVRSLNARPVLATHTAATSITLGVLGLGVAGGEGGGGGAVQLLVSQNAIEAMTAVMRTHAASAATLVAVSNALGCVAISGRDVNDSSGLLTLPAPEDLPGALAISSRGPSRQMLRELQVGTGVGGRRCSARSDPRVPPTRVSLDCCIC